MTTFNQTYFEEDKEKEIHLARLVTTFSARLVPLTPKQRFLASLKLEKYEEMNPMKAFSEYNSLQVNYEMPLAPNVVAQQIIKQREKKIMPVIEIPKNNLDQVVDSLQNVIDKVNGLSTVEDSCEKLEDISLEDAISLLKAVKKDGEKIVDRFHKSQYNEIKNDLHVQPFFTPNRPVLRTLFYKRMNRLKLRDCECSIHKERCGVEMTSEYFPDVIVVCRKYMPSRLALMYGIYSSYDQDNQGIVKKRDKVLTRKQRVEFWLDALDPAFLVGRNGCYNLRSPAVEIYDKVYFMVDKIVGDMDFLDPGRLCVLPRLLKYPSIILPFRIENYQNNQCVYDFVARIFRSIPNCSRGRIEEMGRLNDIATVIMNNYNHRKRLIKQCELEEKRVQILLESKLERERSEQGIRPEFIFLRRGDG